MKLSKLPFFQHVTWSPDARELQQFARAMIIGFAVIGLIAAWKHHHFGTSTFVLWGIGVVLGIGSLLPGVGRWVYLAVQVPTNFIGYFVSHIILTIVFFLVFTPLAAILRLTGKDLLGLKRAAAGSYWSNRAAAVDRESCYLQF